MSFIPQEVGIFDVRVLWNGRDIPGSPFHPRIVNPRKVRVIGGWESLADNKNKLVLTPGEEKKISFDTLDAGPGKKKYFVKMIFLFIYLFYSQVYCQPKLKVRRVR